MGTLLNGFVYTETLGMQHIKFARVCAYAYIHMGVCVCVFARSHKIRSSFAVVRVKYAHFI